LYSSTTSHNERLLTQLSAVGKKNRHCLCETCEKSGRGGYSVEHADEAANLSSDSSSDSNSDSEDYDSDTSSSTESERDKENSVLNVNERRTRRGVYAISKLREDDSDDNCDKDNDNKVPLADANDVPADGGIELAAEIDTGSELTSLAPSVPPSDEVSPIKDSIPGVGVITPIRILGISRSSSSLTDLSSSSDGAPKSNQSTPFRSIISTRRQKERAEKNAGGTNVLDYASPTTSVTSKRLTRSVSTLILSDEKGKARSSQTPCSTPSSSKIINNDSPMKKPENDSRVLRTRLPAAVSEGLKDSVQKPDVPIGLDGKPLPTCSTCSNILPLISVDSQVVWGLSLDVGKKAHQKHDCPRCVHLC
jgi:histone-lysine N-methyltransferase SUV420H